MPLKFDDTETVLPTVSAVPPAAETPRHDPKTVRRILTLADQLQAHHRATSTDEDVVNLGIEVGLEPVFVRQALFQMEVYANARAAARDAKKQWVQAGLSSVWRHLPFLVAAVYILVVPIACVFYVYHYDGDLTAFLLLCVCPGLLGLGVGLSKEKKPLGAWGGGLFALSSFLAICGVALHGHPDMSAVELLIVLLFFLAAGTASGAMGAAIGYYIATGEVSCS